jgi:hypothetical protein
MPDLNTRELLREWQKAMESVVSSAASVGGATAIPRQLLEPMQRQLELVQELLEHERRMQKELAGRLLAPVDAVFDLLEQSGQMLRSQAEALETAGRALEETARVVSTQAELFDRTVGAMREPAERAKTAMGLERRERKDRPRRQRRPSNRDP